MQILYRFIVVIFFLCVLGLVYYMAYRQFSLDSPVSLWTVAALGFFTTKFLVLLGPDGKNSQE